jgi:hypothetical protein
MRSRRHARFGTIAVFCAALAACGGTGFEKPSVVKGVRILAVQKEPAYPRPGETVNLTMLYWDGKRSQSGRSPVQVLWLGGGATGWNCINPKGDLYYECFGPGGSSTTAADASAPEAGDGGADAAVALDAAAFDSGAPMDAGVQLDGGLAPAGLGPAAGIADHASTHQAIIPDTILKPLPPERGVPYGLEYVFFAACAGRFGVAAPGTNADTLPIGCYGPGGELLGTDDFVPGYTTIYAYADRRNANPIVSNLFFDDVPIGAAGGPTGSPPRIPHCTAGNSIDCPTHAIKVGIDRASAEIDPSGTVDGRSLQEQLWVAFFTTAGEFKSELRLVNDSQQGWNEDNGTVWHVPSTPGPVRLWGVVHDNRGGVAWVEGEVTVE